MWLRILAPSAAAFLGGLLVGALRADATPEAQDPYQLTHQLGRVLAQVEQHYVDPVDRAKLLEGAIKGMVESLDPHSAYLPPDEWRAFQSDTEGMFAGVGIEVDGRGDRLVIVAPIEGGPAQRAGLRSGDIIVAIDGDEVGTQPLERIVKRMRGAVGSKVTVTVVRTKDGPKTRESLPGDAGATVIRESIGQTLSFELTREVIRVASIESKLLGRDVAYIRIKQFQERTYPEFLAAIAKLRAEARGRELSGVLLDVRSNPGGLVDEATAIADEFLAQGGIYSMRHRGRIIEDLSAQSGGALVDLPVVALVDAWSASASELLVGALQDAQRATVVGSVTFGKGSVQTIVALPNRAGLKLTTARYYTPSGRSIQAEGICPDVLVERAASVTASSGHIKRERDLPNHLSAEPALRCGEARPGARPRRTERIVEDGGPLRIREMPADPASSTDAILRLGFRALVEKLEARPAK
jgi:carboxyl-terminal processing protease